MLFRRSISVLILVVLLGVAVGVWSSLLPAGWQTAGTVPPAPFATMSMADPPGLPVPGPANATTSPQPATGVNSTQTNQTTSASVPQLPIAFGVPQAQSGGAASQRAFKSGTIPQPTTYPIGDLDGQSLVGALTVAAPDAGFMFFEKDNKKVYVVGTPAEHEKVRQVIKTLANLKEPPVRSPATWPMGLVSASGGGGRLGTPSTVLQRADSASTPPLPPLLPAPLDPETGKRTVEYSMGRLNAQRVADILKVLTPNGASISIAKDGKKLTVEATPAELEKVQSVIKGLHGVMAPSGYRVSGPVHGGAPHSSGAVKATMRPAAVRPPTAGQPAYSYGYSGPPRRSAYGYKPSPRKSEPVDPRMAELEAKDKAFAKGVAEAVEDYKRAADDKERAELRAHLKNAVNEHFAVRQEKQALELSRLEAQLETIRQSIAKRDKAREQIVDRHISKLLGEADELAF